ncbi:Uncharacterised protein [Vibrio cholerae]|nr:Uncharacterised protein [Vibrio cholerae]
MPYARFLESSSARNSTIKSAKFSGGTQVSSVKATGLARPLAAPSKPTAFLRIL